MLSKSKKKKFFVDRNTEELLLNRFAKITLKYPVTEERLDLVFQRLMEVKMPVMYLRPTGKDFFPTMVLNIDEDEIHLDEFVEPKVKKYFESYTQKHKGIVFSFDTKGIDYYFVSIPLGIEYPYNSYPYLKITKPNRIYEQQRRNFYRQIIKNVPPVYVAVKAERLNITNLSGGGLRFFVNDPETEEEKWKYQKGMELVNHHLLLTMPNQSEFSDGAREKPILIKKSTVVNVSPAGDTEEGYSCGLRFDEIDEAERDLVIEYLHVLQTRDRLQRYLAGSSNGKVDW